MLTPHALGDACDVGLATDPCGTGHVIGAAIFRSLEALFGLRWSTATDIWSFGATVSLWYDSPLCLNLTNHLAAHQPDLGAKFPHL
jgi:hypothetical protein